MNRQYHKPEIFSLGSTSGWPEDFVQKTISDDPSILGLGDLVVRDKERRQQHAGRLDFLLESVKGDLRYEVEIQLGPTDPSHIIRTIEYWDLERKRNASYEHVAVIVAEEITSRFFNVISLFNQSIPLIAIKMTGMQLGDESTLLFTKVLDYTPQVDEEESEYQAVDRSYWEKRTNRETMTSIDSLFRVAKEVAPAAVLKYNKSWISIKLRGQRQITLRPQKQSIKMSVHISQSKDLDEKLEHARIDYDDGYNQLRKKYVLRLLPTDTKEHNALLREIFDLTNKSPALVDEDE